MVCWGIYRLTRSQIFRVLGASGLSRSLTMESKRDQTEVKPASSTVTPSPAPTLCRKKKKDDATFLEDVKDHIDEFIHASMDEHKSCFTKTIQKMFRMSKVVEQRTPEQQEIESILPLQTTISK